MRKRNSAKESFAKQKTKVTIGFIVLWNIFYLMIAFGTTPISNIGVVLMYILNIGIAYTTYNTYRSAKWKGLAVLITLLTAAAIGTVALTAIFKSSFTVGENIVLHSKYLLFSVAVYVFITIRKWYKNQYEKIEGDY